MFKSSAFVPAEWNVKNNDAGLVNLITGIVKAIDRQHTPSKGSLPQRGHYSNSHGSHGHHGNGHSHGSQRTMNGNPSMSCVSIIDDRHSIFTRGTLSRGRLPQGSRATVSDNSISTRCPRCKRKVMTVVRRKMGGMNIAATAAVAVVGIVVNAPATLMPLALAALELNALKQKVHYCPCCSYKMGKHVTVSIPQI
ncbi:hypothetical protein GGI25_000920 [Coemansia spiralis]|uniref:LITAF domain-containing protein n=2 Tax=Coemansia TaxID=4863 RepID=A0A9W8L0Q2_9FUNG|nr:hypothetical protein BX070DRAFT_250487 [Coemansia spiralis]KAJ1993778.1 hypothetical protein EDC05_001938 [Coemansia umbellata]KAJ2623154.1 hypothetical protein GGI26_002568 [Coemansia sp. RSA 1358]KAJ2680032.1 hypothetical protein GGI25_000920 [Coemansia spiralis]